MTAPERIWATLEPEWQDGDGNPLVGGKWEDHDITGAGVPYIRADLHDAAMAKAREALAKIACPSQTANLLWWQEEARAALAALEGKMAERIEAAARAICAEQCAFRGEPPCWSFDGEEWPNPNCNEPGCYALARVALFAALDAAP